MQSICVENRARITLGHWALKSVGTGLAPARIGILDRRDVGEAPSVLAGTLSADGDKPTSLRSPSSPKIPTPESSLSLGTSFLLVIEENARKYGYATHHAGGITRQH